MRNLKKFLALVLAMIMVVSAAAVVSADFTDVAADDRYAAAINDLAVKGIVKGTSDTTFGPTQNVTREQMALFVARSITGELNDEAWANGIIPFADVTRYKGAIQCAYLNGIINGTPAGTFDPEGGITYVAALKMAVCALGYGEGLEWPWGYYNKAVELGLTANMAVDTLEAELNRAETAQVIYNMIYAARKDSDKTFAAEKFDIALEENTTLFAITATPKQYAYTESGAGAYNSAADVDGTFVGLQTIVNGVPSGKMLYVAVESIGLTEENVEDYFNYAVELINFDAATGAFTGYVLGEAPKTITQKDVGYASNYSKIKVDDVTYTGVDEFTGASLINEIVIYDGTGVATAAKMLLTNKDGHIIDGKGNLLATLAHNSSTGAKYYYDEEGGNKKVITEATALAKYGVYIDDAEASEYIEYNTINSVGGGVKSTLYTKAYELKLFDDDHDDLYDRAYYSPIYMSVYNTYKGNVGGKEKVVDGMLAKVLGDDYIMEASTVTYTDTAAQEEGAVVVFTYNKQLKTVNVIDVVEMQTGFIDKIDATEYTKTSNNIGKGDLNLTIDGTTYAIAYYYNGSSYTTDAALGADLVAFNEYNTNRSVEDVANKPFISLIPQRGLFIDDLKVDEYVGFYAYNGYIIYASELETKDLYDFAVVEEFEDFNLGEIFLDMWVGAEVQKEARVTSIDGKDLEDLSSYKLSMLISKGEYFYPGTIYAFNKVEDAYNLKEIVDEDNYEDYDLIDAKYADDAYTGDSGVLAFEDGSTRGEDRELRLRTSSNTVFYFINEAECNNPKGKCDPTNDKHDVKCDSLDPYLTEVRVFVGQPDDAKIYFDENSKIWVDALGHGTGKSFGKASVVFVIDAYDEGFFGKTDSVYAFSIIANSMDRVLVDNAEDLGMPEGYTGVYYKYANGAVNLDTGKKMDLYSKVKLSYNKVYKVNEDGVVALSDDNNFNPNDATYGPYLDENGLIPDASADNKNHDKLEVRWTTAGALDRYEPEAFKNYIKYGIYDVSGDTKEQIDDAWGISNGVVNYFDYLWYKGRYNDPDTVAEAVDAYAEGLADVANAVIGGATYEDAYKEEFVVGTATPVIAGAGDKMWDVVEDFLAPFVDAGETVTAADVKDAFAPIDDIDNYYEIETYEPPFFAEYNDDGNVVIEMLEDVAGYTGKYFISEQDDVTDIYVINVGDYSIYDGEEACAILNSATQFGWVGQGHTENLFDEYIKDGSIVFIVSYTNKNK